MEEAKKSDRPVLLKVKTIIGYGAEKQDSHSVHGSPLGPEGCKFLKRFYNLPENETYRISEETRKIFADVIARNEKKFQEWEQKFNNCSYKQEIVDRCNFTNDLTVEKLVEKVQPQIQKFCEANAQKATR